MIMRIQLILSLQLVTASGFASLPTTTRTAPTPRQTPPQQLNMIDIPSVDLPIDLPSFNIASEVLDNTNYNEIEDEAVNGLTHALLDFNDFWGKNQVLLKTLQVIGRMVVLGQSLSHSSSVLPDELLFQVGFLGFACHSLASVVLTKVKTQEAPLMMTSKDRRAFRELFRQAGFSWLQFRELSMGSGVLEWVSVKPGQSIAGNTAFWLYQGDVKVAESESSAYTVTNPSLIGEEHLISLLGMSNGNGFDSTTHYTAGENGATFLRINTDKLQGLLKRDGHLSTSISQLAFTAMQNKLDDALRAKRAATN